MILAIDTETTGLDNFHGAKPFLVTMCDEEGNQTWWEWNVNPLTRQPVIPPEDVDDIRAMILKADRIIMHNAKFDVHMLETIIPDLQWDWNKTYDTLMAAHLLCSNEPKDLTSLVFKYQLRTADGRPLDIEPLEKKLHTACQEARRRVQRERPKWRIAEDGLEDIPSAKKTFYKFDYWLPKAVAIDYNYEPNHPWYTVCANYANPDSAVTLELWFIMEQLIKERNLEKIFECRRFGPQLAHDMEVRGVTYNQDRTKVLSDKYVKESQRLEKECVSIASIFGHDLEIPKKGVNSSLRTFMLDVLELPKQYSKKTQGASLDKNAKDHYKKTLDPSTYEWKFVNNLVKKDTVDTAISYLKDYARFGIRRENGLYRIHPNFNPASSATLRWTSERPNGQNIKKQADEDGYSLRYCFGPDPDREWWSLDAKNIELRIPFYESGEEAMIELFEKPDEPPYYGSNHILVFSVIWPDLWQDAITKVGIDKAAEYCKKEYKGTYYQWTKNGNFAIQYGSGEKNADVTYHKEGAYKTINSRFAKLRELNAKWVAFANAKGYVETLPDRSIDPQRGYPIQCTRTEYGSVLPTVPLSYHVQGTAMWWTFRAMQRCDEILKQWQREGFNAYITMQVHDEIVFDFPRKEHPKKCPRRSNLGRIRYLQSQMERGGDDMGFPQPVGVEYHLDNWGSGESV